MARLTINFGGGAVLGWPWSAFVIDLNALLRRPVEYFETPWALERTLLEARGRLRARAQPGDVEYVFCKSMPRSGHRLLAQCMMQYFHGRLQYCEYYIPFGCCHKLPCVRPYNATKANRFFMQKSHDFGFRDATSLRGKYLIQYRSPIPRLQSNFDLYKRDTGEDSVSAFRAFAERETTYFINFYRKWIATKRPNALTMSYEALVEDQHGTLVTIIGFLQGKEPVDMAALDGVLARVPIGPNALPGSPESIRDPRSHPYFDQDLFAALEARVAEACGTDRIQFHFI